MPYPITRLRAVLVVAPVPRSMPLDPAMYRDAAGEVRALLAETSSDRCGLASAVCALPIAGSREADAAGQRSIASGRFPWRGSRTMVMDRAFAEFAPYGRDERRTLVASDE